MTRVLPLPAPARINTGPSTASTASRCWGLSWDKYEGKLQVTRKTRLTTETQRHRGFQDHFLCVFVPLWLVLFVRRGSVWLASARRRFHRPARLAFLAGTLLAQVLPRVNAML